jgi:hypothetical protein
MTKSKKKDGFNNWIALGALAAGAYYLFGGKASSGTSEGGSIPFSAPLILTPSGESGISSNYIIGSGVSKKVTSDFAILQTSGSMANSMNVITSKPLSFGMAVPGSPYGYGISPLQNPAVAAQQAATKKATAATAIRAAAGQPSYRWY